MAGAAVTAPSAWAQTGQFWRLISVTVEAPLRKADDTAWDIGLANYLAPDMKICVTGANGAAECSPECSDATVCEYKLPSNFEIGSSFKLDVEDIDMFGAHDPIIRSQTITPTKTGSSTITVVVADPTGARRGPLQTTVRIEVESSLNCQTIKLAGGNAKLLPQLQEALDFMRIHMPYTVGMFKKLEARGGKVQYCPGLPNTSFHDDVDIVAIGDIAKDWDALTAVRAFVEELKHSQRKETGWSHPSSFANRSAFVAVHSRELLEMEVGDFAFAMDVRYNLMRSSGREIPILPFNLTASHAKLKQLVEEFDRLQTPFDERVRRFLPEFAKLPTYHDSGFVDYKTLYEQQAARIWECHEKGKTVLVRGRTLCKP